MQTKQFFQQALRIDFAQAVRVSIHLGIDDGMEAQRRRIAGFNKGALIIVDTEKIQRRGNCPFSFGILIGCGIDSMVLKQRLQISRIFAAKENILLHAVDEQIKPFGSLNVLRCRASRGDVNPVEDDAQL